MTDPSKKEISTIVRQVLKETGRASKSSGNPLSTHSAPSRNGPAVLNIFHAGVRKLDEALKQIQQIEETARRSVKCILDTVKPDGLEKALQKADILVLPTFCLRTAAKVANLICDDQESNLVFTALLQGKKVLAANDGFMLCDILVNEPLRQEIAKILNKLEVSGETKTESPMPSNAATSENETPPTVKLITAKVIHTAVDNKQNTIRLAPGGMITPLARDLAKEHSIRIIKTNE
jgi:hypothetical protein